MNSRSALAVGTAAASIVVVAAVLVLRYQSEPAPLPTSANEPAAPPPVSSLRSSPPSSPQALSARQTPSPLAPIERIAHVGGAEIPLRFEVAPRKSGMLGNDDNDAPGFFEPLADAARAGDDRAAVALHYRLEWCRFVPRTEAEFAAAVEKGRDEFAKTGGLLPDGEVQDLDTGIANFRKQFERCAGVTPSMFAESQDLLRESSERGDDDSKYHYAVAIANNDPVQARALFEELWQVGYVRGLIGLAGQSLAHQIANAQLQIAQYGEQPEPMFVQMIAERRAELAALENSVSPPTYAQATREAAEILRNPNCCKL
jgi:hypothetical protein